MVHPGAGCASATAGAQTPGAGVSPCSGRFILAYASLSTRWFLNLFRPYGFARDRATTRAAQPQELSPPQEYQMWDNSSPPWDRGEAKAYYRENAMRTRGTNRSDTGELAKRERLTGRLHAVAPWCVNGSDW